MDDWYIAMTRSRRKQAWRAAVLRRDGNTCHVCTGEFTETRPATLDHMLELAAGGSNHISNLTLAHRACNNHRSNKPEHVIVHFREVVNKTKLNRIDVWEDDGGFVSAGNLMIRNWRLRNNYDNDR